MKKIFYTLCLILMVASCGVTKDGGKKSSKDVIKVGICRSGAKDLTVECFIKSVKDAGGVPIFFKEYTTDTEMADKYVKSVDAVIICGKTANDTVGRSKYDKILIKSTIKAGKPILGICLGHQNINGALGGKTELNEKTNAGSTIKHKIKDETGYNVGLNTEAHNMVIDKDSRLYQLLGAENVMVNTSHNYSIHKLGNGLKIVARADDGIVEAVEGEHIMGVQFHPEYLYGAHDNQKFLAIFKNLVDEAREIKKAK